jgi:hypothetical protein
MSVFCRETVEIFGDFFVQNHDDCVLDFKKRRALYCAVRDILGGWGGRGAGERHSFYVNIAHLTRLFVSISLSLLLYSYT